MFSKPNQRSSDEPISVERQSILSDWNTHHANGSVPSQHLIHSLFQQQAARTPDATAVVFEGSSLTYAELGPSGEPVGKLSSESGSWVLRSWWGSAWSVRWRWWWACWASSRRGGHTYRSIRPIRRIVWPTCWRTVRCRLLLTQARLVDHLPEHRARTVCLDRDWATISSVHGDSFCPGGGRGT